MTHTRFVICVWMLTFYGLSGFVDLCFVESFVFQIIERSLPKKQNVKKDPSEIEKEEMDRVDKYWVNMVRKDIPKHHRFFINFHRKQLTDAKRFSENCQREVFYQILCHLYVVESTSITALVKIL